MRATNDVIIIIPARFASTRFPGKPLHPLRVPNGDSKPLIQWTWDTARRVSGVDAIYIATDSDEIAQTATSFGAHVIMTSLDCRNGTERCADALTKLETRPRLILNVQGDAPLTPASAVSDLIRQASTDPGTAVHTPALRCSIAQFAALEEDARRGVVGATTVVCNGAGHALYFSKQLIPHIPAAARSETEVPILLHMGIYAYSPESLEEYVRHPESVLERLEGLEQLRFLEFGARVGVVAVDPPTWDIWELNNASDIPIVEAGLAKMLEH